MNTYEVVEQIKLNDSLSVVRVVEYTTEETNLKKVKEEYSKTIKYEKFSVKGAKPEDVSSRSITLITKLD